MTDPTLDPDAPPDSATSADGDASADESSLDTSGDESDSDGSADSDENSDDGSGRQRKNALEWAVSGIGLLVVLTVVGFQVYQILFASDEPADLHVQLEAPRTQRGTVMIPLTVENKGDQVAEGAVIEVCAGPESCAELTFRYIPQGSTRTGTVGLSAPLAGPLETRVVSYRTL